MTRKRPAEEVETDKWLLTYGDMVTLLLTFFVLLFSFSTIDAKKWDSIVNSFSDSAVANMTPLDAQAVAEPAIPAIAASAEDIGAENILTPAEIERRRKFEELYQGIRSYIDQNGLGSELSAQKNWDMILVRFEDSVLFESGQAEMKPESIPIMNHIINVIVQNIDVVSMTRIEGHTDDRPISTSRFANNWDLSVARAVNVLMYFAQNGTIESRKLSAVGYGEFQPVESNDNEEGRAANRRVDFVIESI